MYLFFQIFQCFDIEKADYWSESDVFCRITFQNIVKYTDVVPDCANPSWEGKATFIFPIDPTQETVIQIDILDSDGFRSQTLKTIHFNVSDAKDHPQIVRNDYINIKYSEIHILTENDLKNLRTKIIDEVGNKIRTMAIMNT